MNKEYITKDSGKRVTYGSKMNRDSEDGKPRMDLIWTKCQPYEEQFLYKYGQLRARGAIKYCEDYVDINCEKAETKEELCRFKSSAMRHMSQWMCDEDDEAHAQAVLFNLQMAEMVKWKLSLKEKGEERNEK